MTLSSSLKISSLVLLALLPLIAFFAPRSLAYAPAVIGLLGCGAYLSALRFEDLKSLKLYLFITATFGGLALLSCLWSIDPPGSFSRALKFLGVAVPGALFLMYCRKFERRDLDFFTKLFCGSLIVTAVLIIFELSSLQSLLRWVKGMSEEQIITGAYMNRATLFFIFASLFGLYLARISDWTRRSKIEFYVLWGILTALILFKTDSQTVQLSMVLAALSFMIFPVKKKAAYLVFALALAVLLLVSPFMVQYAFKYLAADMSEISWFAYGFAPHRLEIWDFIARFAMEKPLYGHGIEAVRSVGAFDSLMLFHQENHVLHPHNFALQLWAEFGLIGAILGAGILGLIVKSIQSAESTETAKRLILCVFIAALSAASTAYGLWQSWWIGSFIILAGLAVLIVKTDQSA